MLKLVQDASACAEQAPTTVGLDELCRLAAQEMLQGGAAGRAPGLP